MYHRKQQLRDKGDTPARAAAVGRGPITFALAGVLLCAPVLSAHADKALDILRKSITAHGKVAYSGRAEIKVYRGGKCVHNQVQKVIRGTRNRERIEVVEPKAQAGRLIVSDGRTQWEYHPRRQHVIERRLPPPAELGKQKLDALQLVRGSLHQRYLGIATVAGQKCHVIAVSPPDGKHVRKQMWIATNKHVELKWERYDHQGKRTSSWAMTEVDFKPKIKDSAFQFHPPAGVKVKRLPPASRTDLSAAEKKAGFKAIVPSYLPPGFAFQRDQVAVLDLGGRPTLWMRFINGVDTFSIFQARPGKRPPPMGKRGMQWQARGFAFVLVGPVPDCDKRKIKESTRK